MSRGTKVTLMDGKERTLRYDLNAIAEVGERLGIEVRIAHIGEDLLNRPLPLRAIRTVLWAGLLHENPDVTEEEIGKLVDLDNLPSVVSDFFGQFTAISVAAGEAMGEMADAAEAAVAEEEKSQS